MDWIPIVLVIFKALVLFIGMFFAIKWHYDQGRKGRDATHETRAVLRAGGKAAAVFLLALVSLGLATFLVVGKLGLAMQ